MGAMQAYAYAILVAGWLFWWMPFLLIKRNRAPAQVVDRRARWGVVLVAVAYMMLWQNKFWERSLPAWQTALATGLFLLGALLSWTGVRALGRHWRVEAGVNPDHELVTRGPYRVIRHPIYTSMLCLFLGTGCLVTPPLLLLLATVVFIVGTEIRVRIEDGLLASRFGDRFREYQRSVAAYLPFVR